MAALQCDFCDGSATAGKHLVGSGVMNDLKSGTYCGTGMLKLFNSAETFEQEREDHRAGSRRKNAGNGSPR